MIKRLHRGFCRRLVLRMRNFEEGELRPGVFLKAPRGRKAYEICSIRKTGGLGKPVIFHCTVERWSASDVPEHATVVGFIWGQRKRKGAR